MASPSSEMLAARCPQCRARFQIRADKAGRPGRCGQCGHVFTLPMATPKPQLKPVAAEPPQHIGFACHLCGTRMFGSPDQIGTLFKCPDCGANTPVPPAPKPEPSAHPAALDGEQYELWDAEDAPLPSEIAAAQPTYIAIECRLCRTLLHATLDQVGHELKCPDCGTMHVVPPPPKQAKRREVLVPAGDEYEIDPAADPGLRPQVSPPPRRPMLYEEERDAELARLAAQADRGDKRAANYDREGRPILPRWPLLTGILPFLFKAGVRGRWAALSVGLFFVTLLIGLALRSWINWQTRGPNAFGGAMKSALGLGEATVGAILGVLWLAAAASFVMAIITESSSGKERVDNLPSPNPLDGIPELGYVIVAMTVAGAPGWIIGQLTLPDAWQRLAAAGAGLLLLLPIVMLSQLEANSAAAIFSGRIVSSLGRAPFSWILFMIWSAIMLAACGAVTVAAVLIDPLLPVVFAPIYVMAMLLYARLLGRLAWKLAETVPPPKSREA